VVGAVSDNDASIAKLFREFSSMNSTIHFKDPGHCAKGLKKNLKKKDLFGQRVAFRNLGDRIAKFVLQLIKRAEPIVNVDDIKRGDFYADMNQENIQWFREMLLLIPQHYTTGPCDYNCPCVQQWKDAPIDPDERAQASAKRKQELQDKMNSKTPGGRNFLDPGLHANLISRLTVLLAAVSDIAHDLVHGFSTCRSEGVNHCRTTITPKRTDFWKSFFGRSYLAIYNEKYSFFLMVCKILGIESIPESVKIFIAAENKELERRSANKKSRKYKKARC
jgi:hypothetical protein